MSKSIGLNDEQEETFEQAKKLVEDDVKSDFVEAKVWGDSVPDGEVVRILAEAYKGEAELL